jgi:protein TonB
MRQETGAESVLFASILKPHAHHAARRARLLRVVPLILAMHILAVMVLAPGRGKTAGLPVRAGNDNLLVLKLLAAPPALPSAVAAAAVPTQPARSKAVARREALRLKPAPLPAPVPVAEESLPPPEDIPEANDAPPPSLDTSEAGGGAASPSVALDSVEGLTVGGGVSGVVGGVLPSSMPPPPPLTPEEREAWVERYMETLIRARFMRVRYPHLASAAGIKGEVMLRVSINAQGRLLELEQIGRCPHPVLCDSALETVRNAEPFPPPPPELGTPFILELPFRYRLY